MNTIQSSTSVTQGINSGLRDLSWSEYAEVNGGLACYRNPPGSPNLYRYVFFPVPADLPAGLKPSLLAQRWNGNKYVSSGSGNAGIPVTTVKRFKAECRQRGYSYFQ
jgi:hypothetical protein